MTTDVISDLEKKIEVLERQLAAVAANPTKGTKSKGVGAVWGNSTEAVAEVSKSVTHLAISGTHLAKQAELHAALGRIDGSMELLEAVGIEGLSGTAAIDAADLVLQRLRR